MGSLTYKEKKELTAKLLEIEGKINASNSKESIEALKEAFAGNGIIELRVKSDWEFWFIRTKGLILAVSSQNIPRAKFCDFPEEINSLHFIPGEWRLANRMEIDFLCKQRPILEKLSIMDATCHLIFDKTELLEEKDDNFKSSIFLISNSRKSKKYRIKNLYDIKSGPFNADYSAASPKQTLVFSFKENGHSKMLKSIPNDIYGFVEWFHKYNIQLSPELEKHWDIVNNVMKLEQQKEEIQKLLGESRMYSPKSSVSKSGGSVVIDNATLPEYLDEVLRVIDEALPKLRKSAQTKDVRVKNAQIFTQEINREQFQNLADSELLQYTAALRAEVEIITRSAEPLIEEVIALRNDIVKLKETQGLKAKGNLTTLAEMLIKNRLLLEDTVAFLEKEILSYIQSSALFEKDKALLDELFNLQQEMLTENNTYFVEGKKKFFNKAHLLQCKNATADMYWHYQRTARLELMFSFQELTSEALKGNLEPEMLSDIAESIKETQRNLEKAFIKLLEKPVGTQKEIKAVADKVLNEAAAKLKKKLHNLKYGE